ncbi:Shedu immune nuclease family protein [Pseudomonas syringae]|uniref:Shedu immune nuclease family protein n=1 Tax=Pseudomonas syringae TaxID=317 RepID=UPI000E32BF64|nr:Shedu immune nuclease family protein [Pseudomonas syringae]
MDNYQNPEPGKTYISPQLDSFGDKERKVRIATKLIEHPETYAFAKINSELVLRHKDGAKSCITAKFFEDDRKVFVLNIQGYTVATDKPHNASFSFIGDEIEKLVEFLHHVQSMPLEGRGPKKITDENLRRLVLSSNQARAMLQDNQALFAEVIKSAVTKEDIIAVGYRKRQLEVFERLLKDEAYFEKIRTSLNCKDEMLWQRFFEKNPWIFGYGLSYIYASSLDDKRLEQVVQGYSISNHGKRVDGLLKTRGLVSSLCFAEIKTHKTHLLQSRPYRAGCWAPSNELAGGVCQTQVTVSSAVDSIQAKLAITDESGSPTGEEAFNYMPKSFLVIGSLQEFVSEHGVNEEKYRSFEMYRRNTSNPEIITFDELYERARFIVTQHEQ